MVKLFKYTPSSWWYLPPVIAVGLVSLAMGVFTPILVIIYAIPSALIAGVVGFIVRRSFSGNSYAKKWSTIIGTWVFAITMWVLPQLYWVMKESDPCKNTEKHLATIQKMLDDDTWQLPPSFFTAGRKEERIQLTATSDFITQLGLGRRTGGKISPALRLLQNVRTYDRCLEERWGRRLELFEAETNDLVAVISGQWSLVDCRQVDEAKALVEAMINHGYWNSLEVRTVNGQVAEGGAGDPQMVLNVSEKFRQPTETPVGEATKNYRRYYNAAAIFAICTGYSGELKIDEPWDDGLQRHRPKSQDSNYLNDPIELPKTLPNW